MYQLTGMGEVLTTNATKLSLTLNTTLLSRRAESSIETSSDAWATLVANIAPLLVLVGEKHIKGYFKVMCRQSHYLLFAAGPIC